MPQDKSEQHVQHLVGCANEGKHILTARTETHGNQKNDFTRVEVDL